MEYKKIHLDPEFKDQLFKISGVLFDGFAIDCATTVETSDHKWHLVYNTWPEIEYGREATILINLILTIKEYFKKIVILEELGDKNISVILRCFIDETPTEIFIFIINNKFLVGETNE